MLVKKFLQIGKYYPPQWGGIETVTYNIEEALSKSNINNAVLVFGNNSNNDKYQSKSNNIIRNKYYKFFGVPLSVSFFKNLKKINSEYTHIIVHLPNPWAILCLLLIPFQGKLILYWHSDIINKGIFGYLISPLEFWIIKKASLVIAPTLAHIKFSKYSSQFINKYQIIQFPINNDLLKIAENSTSRNLLTPTNNKPLKLVCTGRLVNYKGFEFLISSIPSISNIIPCTLDIIGDGPLMQKLNSLIFSLKLQDKITLHGSLTFNHLHKILSTSDIYCLTSNTNAEMYGMVQYEAMAHGLPIIASNIPKSGVPFLINFSQAGLLFEPNNEKDFINVIMHIICEPNLYNKLSKSGLDSIKNKFSAEKFLTNFMRD